MLMFKLNFGFYVNAHLCCGSSVYCGFLAVLHRKEPGQLLVYLPVIFVILRNKALIFVATDRNRRGWRGRAVLKNISAYPSIKHKRNYDRFPFFSRSSKKRARTDSPFVLFLVSRQIIACRLISLILQDARAHPIVLWAIALSVFYILRVRWSIR